MLIDMVKSPLMSHIKADTLCGVPYQTPVLYSCGQYHCIASCVCHTTQGYTTSDTAPGPYLVYTQVQIGVRWLNVSLLHAKAGGLILAVETCTGSTVKW